MSKTPRDYLVSFGIVKKFRRNIRLLREELTGRGSLGRKKIYLTESELTELADELGLTLGKTFSEWWLFDKKTFEEKVKGRIVEGLYRVDVYALDVASTVEEYGSHSRFGSHSPQWIDARFETLREEKIKKWREKGYSERLIRRALAYANDYSIGIGEALGVSPDVIYPKALEFADQWLEELTKALFV